MNDLGDSAIFNLVVSEVKKMRYVKNLKLILACIKIKL